MKLKKLAAKTGPGTFFRRTRCQRSFDEANVSREADPACFRFPQHAVTSYFSHPLAKGSLRKSGK